MVEHCKKNLQSSSLCFSKLLSSLKPCRKVEIFPLCHNSSNCSNERKAWEKWTIRVWTSWGFSKIFCHFPQVFLVLFTFSSAIQLWGKIKIYVMANFFVYFFLLWKYSSFITHIFPVIRCCSLDGMAASLEVKGQLTTLIGHSIVRLLFLSCLQAALDRLRDLRDLRDLQAAHDLQDATPQLDLARLGDFYPVTLIQNTSLASKRNLLSSWVFLKSCTTYYISFIHLDFSGVIGSILKNVYSFPIWNWYLMNLNKQINLNK